MRAECTIVAMALLCLLLSQRTQAELYHYNDGGMHNISSGDLMDLESITVDEVPPPAPAFTTVNFGGTAWAGELRAFNNSRVILNDGQINTVETHDYSQATMNGGCADFLTYDYSQVTINDGGMRSFTARDNSEVIMNNGSVGGMGYFCAYDNSRVTINGGGTELRARHNSQVTINGGQICPLITSDNSRVIMNGGDIGGDSFIRSSSPLIVNGGSTGCLFGGQVIVNGGQIRGVSGTLCTFVGSDFAVYSDEDGTDLVFSGYGNFAPSSGTYWLWGTLATGDLLAGTALYFDVCAWGGGSDVSFVPLPGAVLLGVLGLSVAGWRLRRRA